MKAARMQGKNVQKSSREIMKIVENSRDFA